MSRKKMSFHDELDQILLDAQRIRGDKERQGVSLPTIPISKRTMEFAQSFGAIRYREMREMLSLMSKCKKLESEFFRIATSKLPFKPDNWAFFFLKGHSGINPPGFIPEIFEKGRGLVAKVDEIKRLLEEDAEVRRAYDNFETCWWGMDHLTYAMSEWIREQFRNGTLEEKLEHFKGRKEEKKKTRISKSLVSNFVNPAQAKVVQQNGELPELGVGEREAMQFLLWKIENMTERETHIKNEWILDGEKETPRKNGYVVVFERTEVLKKSYGESMDFSGKHFNSLEKNLLNLLEKKRKLILIKKGEKIEISKTLVNHIEMRHEFTSEPGFKDYITVWIPYEVAHLHDKLYTSYPANHIALMRNTPPESRLTESEIRFFDILWQEAPHNRSKPKEVRRMKNNILDLVGGQGVKNHEHGSRLAGRIEALFAPKAINMGILKKFRSYQNQNGEDVYEWEYSDESTLNRLLNKGKTPKYLDCRKPKD